MRRSVILSAAIVGLGFCRSANGGNYWVGGGGDNLWTNPANWSPSGNPGSGSTSDLFFTNTNGYYTSVNNYGGWTSWRNLTFSAYGPFSLSSQAGCNLDLYGRIENYGNYTASLGFADIALQADAQVNPFYRDITINAAHVYTNGRSLSVFGNNSWPVTFGPGTDITGDGKLRLAEWSILKLQGACSYTGNTEIDTGYFQVYSTISPSSTVYLGNGGTSYGNRHAYLQFFSTAQTYGNPIVVNKADTGSGVGGGERAIITYHPSGTLTLANRVELNGELRLGANYSGVLEVSGDIVNGSDTSPAAVRSLRLLGGRVALSGTNSYTGNTTITSGVLQVGSAGAIPNGVGKGFVFLSPGSTLDMNGFDVALNGPFASNTSSVIDNQRPGATGSYTLSIGLGNDSGLWNGTIRNTYGTVSLRKLGTGNMAVYGVKTYSGDTRVEAGTLSIGGTDPLPHGVGKGDVRVQGAGVLNLNASSATINGLWGDGKVDNLSGAGAYTLTVGDADRSSLFSGSIRNNLGGIALSKVGNGTLTLSGNNSYVGSTRVDAGVLLVNGTHSPAGAYTAYGGTLGGSGTINAAVTVDTAATIAPGTSVGTLRTGNLSIAGTYLAEIDLDGSAADRIDVTGSVTLTNATLQFAFVSSSSASTPRTLVIVRNDGNDPVSGAFTNFVAPWWVTYSVSHTYNADGGSVGNDVAVTIEHVPEPAGVSLVACTAALLARRARRRRYWKN